MFGRKGLDTAVAVRRTAMDLLARREHTWSELQRKLKQRGADSALIEQELQRLEDDGLLSHERFCEAYVHARSQRGYGPQRLREELRQRGVSEELIERTLSSPDWDWNSFARTAFNKRFPEGRATEPAERARQRRFMQYRGFADFPDD